MVDLGQFAVFHVYFNDVEAPGELAGAEQPEPRIGTALDEGLFLLGHSVETPDFGTFPAGFHFNEKQELVVSGDDIDLASTGAFVISSKYPAALRAEPVGGDLLTVVSQPNTIPDLPVRRRQEAGRVERPAETTDDDGNKGRVSEAFQGAPWCHIPGVSQSRIEGTRCQVGA